MADRVDVLERQLEVTTKEFLKVLDLIQQAYPCVRTSGFHEASSVADEIRSWFLVWGVDLDEQRAGSLAPRTEDLEGDVSDAAAK